MRRIEKTVFICYRRTHFPWAKAISQHLSGQGYDVFFDFMSLNSGDFEQLITENIKARAHFLVLLAPSGLERCCDPKDWVRREIEIALDNKRNIVPILLEGFDFGAPETLKCLTGKLEKLGSYNAINIYAEYFDAAMQKLCDRFLNIPLDEVFHPVLPEVSSSVQVIVEEQKRIVAEQPPVKISALSALEWFERAYKAKEPEEEIRLYTRAIHLDPNFTKAYLNRGVSYYNLKQYKQAIEDFDRAIELNPEYALAYSNRGDSYSDLKQYEWAIEDFDQAIKLNPDNAEAYLNRGCSYNNLKQYERSIEDYDRAIKADPKLAIAYSNRGISYNDLKQYERAIEDFDRAIKLNPESAVAYSNRGVSYYNLKQCERSIEDYDRAIKLNPEYAEAYSNRGVSYNDLKQYERAIEDFDRAIKLNPEYAKAYLNRGNSYCGLKQYERAIEDFDRAIKLNPEFGSSYYNKACAYALQGQEIETIKWLRQAFAKDLKHYCELARQDSDFDGVRGKTEFRKLLKEFCDKS
jgi:tetratricopeptide (TPR) repeat protein